MFKDASSFPWHVEGNVLYRIDKVKGGTEKKTEIARFRVFQIQGKSKLKGVSAEEAHDNAALVANAVEFWKEAEKILRKAAKTAAGAAQKDDIENLLTKFYAKEDVSQPDVN